ncbi:hypothetical protein GN958_ATG17283 [Phytophthora infestans]|uniref:Uncharacterized protein n=1 Tax=Phytophthora infestans TaxID=4787 RepID=A0A8S9TXQ1_PHYIN|nr:hypothetical protein GN958_ATG17283 [Phytophthora infestans]
MEAQLIASLVQFVDRVDYGPHKDALQKIKPQVPYSKNIYVLGAFSWTRVTNSSASTGDRWLV